MSFGGYKFKGYKVVRENLVNNTYANWCLLVHQARIKAFMESCDLSGAQWHFSKTNGDLSFEDYGNVIYRVANGNGEYHDYMSFFKYGNEELYYMIASLGEYYQQSSVGTPVKVKDSEYTCEGASNYDMYFKYAGYASALSLEDFSDLGCFGTYPTKALPCTSQLASGSKKTYTNGVKENTSGFALSYTTIMHIGYATKGKDIITIPPLGANYACIESGDAFSALCDPHDEYKLVKINLGFGYSSSETSHPNPSNSQCLDGWNNECLNSSGNRINNAWSLNSNYKNVLALVPSTLPYFTSGGQHIPYGSAYLSLLQTTYNKAKLNNENMLIKGVVNNELLSVNCFNSASRNFHPTPGTPVMGGNLLTCMSVQCIPSMIDSKYFSMNISGASIYGGYGIPGTSGWKAFSTTDTKYYEAFMYPVAYVGWDSSNPDILDESSWSELTLQ